MAPADGTAAVARLRDNPPTVIGGRSVTATTWYQEAGLLRVQLGDALRLQVRPSGTEPKVKFYGEAIDEDPRPYLDALIEILE